MAHFSELFLQELFYLCFYKTDVLDLCCKHLQYHHINKETYKFIWKGLKSYYEINNRPPTFGYIAQEYNNKIEVIADLNKIKETESPIKEDILKQLEDSIKNSYFQNQTNSIIDFYNAGETDKAFNLLKETSEFVGEFSLKKDSLILEPVFGGFERRNQQRIIDNSQINIGLLNKIPFFIDEVDEFTFGGCNKQDIWLALSQSGEGKSKLLKFVGVNTSRIGGVTLHIQGEGSKKECLDLYDSCWTGQQLSALEIGQIPEEIYPKLKQVIKNITYNKGEIYVYAAEEFDSLSMRDVRNLALEVIKITGRIDLILIDYIDLMEPGDGKIYGVGQEREKRRKTSRQFKNICIEVNAAGGTCTQASSVDPQDLNNPSFVMTRYHTSEFKNALEAYSYFFSLNRTKDEYDMGVMRLHFDKIRKYKANQTITICSNYEYERFYDKGRTMRYLEGIIK